MCACGNGQVIAGMMMMMMMQILGICVGLMGIDIVRAYV